MRQNQILALMCGVVAMTVLDLSVVNVALPVIQDELDADPADLQWIVVAYAVAVAGFLLLGGRLGDLAGHRAVLVAGVVVLAAASLAGGLAGSLEVLIAARAGQGLGAALAAPNALAILSRTFAEGPERNRALGLFAAAGGTAAIAGTVVGGLLVQGPGWPWVFLLNVPLGAALAATVLARVPPDRPAEPAGRPDVLGAVLLTAGLMAVAFGVHQSVEAGWASRETLLPLLAGLGLLGTFVVHQGRAPSPLVPLRTLRRRSVASANLASGLLWASFLGLIYHATLFIQQDQGWTPLAAGASTIPIAVLSLTVSARVAPRIIDRFGAAATLAAGMLVLGIGMLLLARVPDDVGFVIDLLPAYAVIGLGLGLAEVAVQIAALEGVSPGEAGLVGGALESAREMGGALGLALLVSIALSGVGDASEAFRRSVVGAAVFAALSAIVALVLLRPAERTTAMRRA